MSKRPLHAGQRVHTRFWNEVTLEKFGQGPENPKISTGTLRSVSGGRAIVDWDDDGPHAPWVSPALLHRGNPEDGPDPALRWRERTWWNNGRKPESPEVRTYRFSSRARPNSPDYIPFREWLRRAREYDLRYNQPALAQERVRQGAKELARQKRHAALLAEQLRTPMTFPPGHPGCDEPIYPMLHPDGNRLGDGWRCRVHGDVTAAVMDHYYSSPQPSRRRA